MPETDPSAEQLPVSTTVHKMAYGGIMACAVRWDVTFETAVERLIYAGIHLHAATNAGYGLPRPATRAELLAMIPPGPMRDSMQEVYAGTTVPTVADHEAQGRAEDDRRREWVAALRWAADEAAEPFAGAQDGDLDSTDLRQLADRIEADELSPWTDTTEETP